MTEVSSAVRELAFVLDVPPQVHPDDFIYEFLRAAPSIGEKAGEHYFNDGRVSAQRLRSLLQIEAGMDVTQPFSLLEFASGYGCVTRHLATMLPAAQLTACDIHDDAVAFIQTQLGQTAINSTGNPAEFDLGTRFDVVFALSFFSHMPHRTWGGWLEALFRHLNPGGRLVFTTHGEVSQRKLFGPDVVLNEDGFWFHASSEQHDLDTADYGTTITSTAYVSRQVYRRLAAPIALVSQGAWWGHQDVYVIVRPA